MKRDGKSGLGAFLEHEDAMQPQQPADGQRLDTFDQDTGVRATLKRIFPLSSTGAERRRFLGLMGRKSVGDEYFTYAEGYIGRLSIVATYRTSLPLAVLFMIFFAYLSYKGVDVSAYLSGIYASSTGVQTTGISGLYAYYYAHIMYAPCMFIALACFTLFLIHVKKGEVVWMNRMPLIRDIQDRSFVNMTKTFLLECVVGGMGYIAVKTWYLGLMDLMYNFLPLYNLGFIGVLLSGVVICLLGCAVQAAGVVAIYTALISTWSILFRYDRK